MKAILSVMFMLSLVLPTICSACPLCTPWGSGGDHPVDCVRWAPASFEYSCYYVGDLFKAKLDTAITEWRSSASIKVESGGSDWDVYWDDYCNPTEVAATTSVWYGVTDGKISSASTIFNDTILASSWNWTNTCSGPTNSTNLYKVMLHEFGHAIGLALPINDVEMTITCSSVMQQGVCYTHLQPCDTQCARFLYQGNADSRVRYFAPVLQGGGVAIKWQSRYEHETSHFYVEKRTADGSYVRIIDNIASSGADHAGASYECFDPAGTRSDVYRLIEVDREGNENGVSAGGVKLADGAQDIPISLSEAERSALKRDIAAVLNKQTGGKDSARKTAATAGVEWLAIYPMDFSDAIADLITYRNNHGLNASGAVYQNVISGYGSIKSYLQYLWNSQGHVLKYVLIVGNYTRIPVDSCQDGEVGGFYADYTTDAITADVNDDWYPEISMGRIPALSADEVTLYVAKALNYEEQGPSYPYGQDVGFLVYDTDGAFGYQSGPVAATYATELSELIPATYTVHYESSEAQPPDQCALRTTGIGEFDAGRGTIVGFGSISDRYGLVEFLSTSNSTCRFYPTQLSQNYKYAFVLGASCDMGDMHVGPYTWIFRDLLFANYKGAIACFGPTGSSWQGANYDICATVLNYLYNWGTPTVGHACYSAQRDEMADELPGNAHTARSYIFYGDPAIRLHGAVYNGASSTPHCNAGPEYPAGKNFFYGCPAGDQDTMQIVLDFDFDFGSWTIEPDEVTLDMAPADSSFKLFNDGPINPGYATSDTTVIAHEYMGGCGCDSLQIQLDGDSIGSVMVAIRSSDLNADSEVNLSDLPTFGASFNSCRGDSNYNECCDFTGDDACNLSDFGLFGMDWSHEYFQGQQLSASLDVLSRAGLRIVLDQSGDNGKDRRLLATISIENANGISNMCLALSNENKQLEYARWIPNSRFPQTTAVAPIENNGRAMLFIASFGTQLLNSDAAEMGTIEFIVKSDESVDLSDQDLGLIYGEVMEESGTIKKLKGAELVNMVSGGPTYVDDLASNYPNPFNPSTIIEYSIAKDSHVDLSIYNAAGQRIRTLVNGHKKANRYTVLWDGKNDNDKSVCSGVYFYVLKTDTFRKAKKLVILR